MRLVFFPKTALFFFFLQTVIVLRDAARDCRFVCLSGQMTDDRRSGKSYRVVKSGWNGRDAISGSNGTGQFSHEAAIHRMDTGRYILRKVTKKIASVMLYL